MYIVIIVKDDDNCKMLLEMAAFPAAVDYDDGRCRQMCCGQKYTRYKDMKPRSKQTYGHVTQQFRIEEPIYFSY